MSNKNKEYFKKWWKKNKHLHRDRIKIASAKQIKLVRENVTEYLSKHPCVDCENSDVRVLEFDHVKDKKFKNISTMIYQRYSWNRILKEIEKCEVRCANCHRIRTKLGYLK